MIKRLPVIFLCCFAAVPLRLGAEDLVIKKGLVLRIPRTVQRSAFAVDPVEMMMAARTWKAPKPGDAVAFSATESAKWDKIAADANGWFATQGDSYVDARISSARAQVMIGSARRTGPPAGMRRQSRAR